MLSEQIILVYPISKANDRMEKKMDQNSFVWLVARHAITFSFIATIFLT